MSVDEREPNDGPTVAGAQDLGAFSGDETLTLRGTLAKGGNDGSKYTGDPERMIWLLRLPAKWGQPGPRSST